MSDDNDNRGPAKRWLDDNIVPLFIDAPSSGPQESDAREDENPGPADRLCPVCFHAMSRHTEEIEPNSRKVFLRCPDSDTVIETEREVPLPGTQDAPILD